jgi:hypothetical protein
VALPKPRKPIAPVYTKTQAENDQQELVKIKAQIKELGKREDELKARLESYMMKAFKPDSKGHLLFTVAGADGKNYNLQRQRRRKITLNQEKAIPWLRENKFLDAIKTVDIVAAEVTQDQLVEALLDFGYASYVDTKEIADDIAISQLVQQGIISIEDMEALCDFSDTYAMTYIKDDDVKKAQQEEEAAHAAANQRQDVSNTNKTGSKGNRPVSNRQARI